MGMIGPLQIVFVLLWLVVLPVILGLPLLALQENGQPKESLLFAYLYGILFMLAFFWALALPMILLKCSFLWLVVFWLVFLFGCGAASMIFLLWKKRWAGIREKLKASLLFIWEKKNLMLCLAVIGILFQTVMLTVFSHVDDDDSFYVATAVTTWSEHSMYVIDPYTGRLYSHFPWRYFTSPFPVFVAAISQITGLHPAIMAHTILPILLIPLAYLLYWVFFGALFGEEDMERRSWFLLFLCLMVFFGAKSVYSMPAFLTFRIWQGKAILASILIPFAFTLGRVFLNRNLGKKEIFLLLLLSMGAALVSSMGVVLMPIVYGVIFLPEAVRQKKISVLFKAVLACLPCMINGGVYLWFKMML